MTLEEAAEIEQQKEREQLDSLTLTPADVERALYKALSLIGGGDNDKRKYLY